MNMLLTIWTPEAEVCKTNVGKIVAEAPNGFFCLLPRHIDFLSVLEPGMMTYTDKSGDHYWAINQGILVKCGLQVMVSARNAIPGESLEQLEHDVVNKFRQSEEKEEEMRIAMDQLEADFIRRFTELEKL